ncbi:MAG TPA: hypothetical protein VMK05_00585 [Burkholderiales bacterium]|nr:hypothetical protein [Burkholderiales bacterium]
MRMRKPGTVVARCNSSVRGVAAIEFAAIEAYDKPALAMAGAGRLATFNQRSLAMYYELEDQAALAQYLQLRSKRAADDIMRSAPISLAADDGKESPPRDHAVPPDAAPV